ncbi:MAG: hypothetical protein ABII00_10090 [Elusimicrobiota bacterium]
MLAADFGNFRDHFVNLSFAHFDNLIGFWKGAFLGLQMVIPLLVLLIARITGEFLF